jgi:hypothetical protein
MAQVFIPSSAKYTLNGLPAHIFYRPNTSKVYLKNKLGDQKELKCDWIREKKNIEKENNTKIFEDKKESFLDRIKYGIGYVCYHINKFLKDDK